MWISCELWRLCVTSKNERVDNLEMLNYSILIVKNKPLTLFDVDNEALIKYYIVTDGYQDHELENITIWFEESADDKSWSSFFTYYLRSNLGIKLRFQNLFGNNEDDCACVELKFDRIYDDDESACDEVRGVSGAFIQQYSFRVFPFFVSHDEDECTWWGDVADVRGTEYDVDLTRKPDWLITDDDDDDDESIDYYGYDESLDADPYHQSLKWDDYKWHARAIYRFTLRKEHKNVSYCTRRSKKMMKRL